MKALIIACLAVTLLAISCKKKDDIIQPPVKPIPVLSIELANPYLRGAQVDSAFAYWSVNDVHQKIQLEVRNDSMIALMDKFNAGSGKLTIHIFANKKFGNQYKGQWIMNKDISIEKTTAVNIAGPVSFFDAAWLPRVELVDAVGHFAVLGLRPDDPYFFVKDVKPNVVKLTVAKGYSKGIQTLAYVEWDCPNHSCENEKRDVENTTAFKNFPAMLVNKEWKHIELYVMYNINANGEGAGLSLQYEP